MSESRYMYTTMRVVPSVAAGEFVNLAVIAGSDDSGQWAIRLLSDEARARRFCGAEALAAGHDVIAHLGEQIDLHDLMVEGFEGTEGGRYYELASQVSERWLHDLHVAYQRGVQFSAPAPVLAETVDDALDLVFPRVTVQPEPKQRRSLTKWALLSALQKSYASAGLRSADHLLRGPTLIAQGSSQYTYAVDFAVANGHALQIVQTWSFEVAAQETVARDVKAWGWTVQELRQHGGIMELEGRRVEVPSEVEMQAVVAPPRTGQSTLGFDEASGVFRELQVAVSEYGAEAAVARRGAELLARATGVGTEAG